MIGLEEVDKSMICCQKDSNKAIEHMMDMHREEVVAWSHAFVIIMSDSC